MCARRWSRAAGEAPCRFPATPTPTRSAARTVSRRTCIPAEEVRVEACWNASSALGGSVPGHRELDDLANHGRELPRQRTGVVGHAVALADVAHLRRDFRVPERRDV